MTLRVLAFVPNPPADASGRYRVYQMAPLLRERGVELDVHPFLTEDAFARLYRRGGVARKAIDLAAGAARRWSDLARARNYDLALIHRQLWPLRGDAPLARLRAHQRRWVFDFDDAVFLPNVSRVNRSFARLKPFDQPRALAAESSGVTAGNAWLAEWARRQRPGRPASEVAVIPTAVDTDRWTPRPRTGGPLRIAWTGSHSTVGYLDALRPAFARLGERHPGLELHVVGAGFRAEGLRVVEHPWSADGEVARVGACDVAVSPLPDDDWSRGKCGLKLLLYLALGLPAVVSPFGVHGEIIAHGENGLLAATPEAFEHELERLLDDPQLRTRLGRAGRHTVESRYSLRAVAPAFAAALRTAADGG